MFTQKISMDCTKDQYEKYLKDEMVKMGYKEAKSCTTGVIINNFNCDNGSCGLSFSDRKDYGGRTYLGSFNAPLFLALAAMTDDFGYGEWSVLKSGVFVRRQEIGEGYCYENGEIVEDGAIFRDDKASVEEIKAHFAQAIPIHKGDITFDVKLDTAGISEILDNFNKGLEMIMKREMLTAYLEKVDKDIREILGTDEKHKEPIVGEMAIFWDEVGIKESGAIIAIYAGRVVSDPYPFKASRGLWANAILYESPDQYKAFLKS